MHNKVELITASRQRILKLLLEDPRVSQIVLTNNEVPQSIKINADGSVTFGRTPRKWWNWLWNDTITVSFIELSLRMLSAYKQYTSTENASFARTLTKEIVENAIDRKDYDWIIDKFLLHAVLGVNEGDYKNSALDEVDKNPQRSQNGRGNNVHGEKRQFKNVGTVGINLGGGIIEIPLSIVEQ